MAVSGLLVMSRSGVRFPEAAPPLTSGFVSSEAVGQVRIMVLRSQCGRSAHGALQLKHVDAAARRLRPYHTSRPLQTDIAPGRLGPYARSAVPDLDLSTCSFGRHRTCSAVQSDVTPRRLSCDRAVNQAGRDLAPVCVQTGVPFHVTYPDVPAGRAGFKPLTNIAERDVPARSLDFHGSPHVSGANITARG